MAQKCISCAYGGLVCGRGLKVQENYKSCVGFTPTPGGSLRGRLGISPQEYVKTVSKNVLDQAPKFSFEIEEYRILVRRLVYKFNSKQKAKFVKYYYFLKLREPGTFTGSILEEIEQRYPGHYLVRFGLSSICIVGPTMTKEAQAKLKHNRNKKNVSF